MGRTQRIAALAGLAGLLLGGLLMLFVLAPFDRGAAEDVFPTEFASRAAEAAPPDDSAPPPDVAFPASSAAEPASDAPTRLERLRVTVVRWPDRQPLPAARVSLRALARPLLEDAAVSAQGRLELALPRGARHVDVAASAPGHESVAFTFDLAQADGEVLVELSPLTGWVGRVTLPTGEGVADVQVAAHSFWPPRPALFQPAEGGQPVFTSTEGRAPAIVTAPTSPEGYYYVLPFATDNVVDLALAVSDARLASDLLRVALPTSDVHLPDLVLRSVEPLSVLAVDAYGVPVPGVSLAVDRGPGLRHEPEELLATGADGRASLPRHRGRMALAASHPLRDLVGRATDGRTLPDSGEWIAVDASARELVLTFDAPGFLRGVLLDAYAGQALHGGRVALSTVASDGSLRALDSAVSRADGTFELRAPAALRFASARVRIEVDGHLALDEYAPLSPDAEAPRVPFRLVPIPGARTIVASLRSFTRSFAQRQARVRIWRAPRGTPVAPAASVLLPASEPLDARFVLQRDELIDAQFEFVLLTLDPVDDLLALLVEVTDDRDVPHFASWGPRTIEEAAQRPIRFLPQSAVPLDVTLRDLGPEGGFFLAQATWHPWLDEVAPRTVWIPEGAAEERRLEVLVSGSAQTFLELRLDRGPVSASLARFDAWFDPARHEEREFLFQAPPTRRVQGRVQWYTEADWPDTALALLGPAVDEQRLDALGESDWCVRPARDGSWRLENVPVGEYLLVLYQPVGDEGVEILAQRSLNLRDNLFQVEIRPETVGGRGRFTIAR